MKTIKYILFLFLFIIISCKSIKNTPAPPPPPVVDKGSDTDSDGVADYMDGESVGSIVKLSGPKLNKDIDIIYLDSKNIVPKKELPKKEIEDPQYSVGHIATKVPKEMTVGKSYLVKIRITKENNLTVLTIGDRNIPIDDDNGNSIVTIEKISISPIMSANLKVVKGTFKIDTLSTEYQNISKKGYTEWAWNIIPIKSGQNLLKLNVKVRIKEDGETYYKDIVVFDQKVKIKSNIRYTVLTWFSEYWQWLFGVILIPIIKVIYDEWKKRRDKKEEV